jgi:hypothetical protein
MVEENEPKNDHGANVRMWAEWVLWLPAALLTDPQVEWRPIDEETALLVVPFGDEEDHLVVCFDPETRKPLYVEPPLNEKGRLMIAQTSTVTGSEPAASATVPLRVGFYAAVLTAVLTLVTFAFAITAMPNSGAGCPGDCFVYPYLDTLSQYPQDYWWMFPAIVLILVYMVLMTSLHFYAAAEQKIFSQLGLSFALIAAIVLLIDYFVQVSIIPVSLLNGETEGITLLTQYNPHGLFIVLEELGYLMMSLSFLCMAPVFARRTRLESAIAWIFIAGFVLAIGALLLFSLTFGLERQDRFEIAVISIDWLVLIINGVLLSILFHHQMRIDQRFGRGTRSGSWAQ